MPKRLHLILLLFVLAGCGSFATPGQLGVDPNLPISPEHERKLRVGAVSGIFPLTIYGITNDLFRGGLLESLRKSGFNADGSSIPVVNVSITHWYWGNTGAKLTAVYIIDRSSESKENLAFEVTTSRSVVPENAPDSWFLSSDDRRRASERAAAVSGDRARNAAIAVVQQNYVHFITRYAGEK